MRPFKPAPKNASANRIRERYLHQLGLQRGAVGAPLAAPHDPNHVVVISGLPSLPEDRATTEHIMESHDFSIASRHSQHTSATQGSETDANKSCAENNDDTSDSGSAHGGVGASNNVPLDSHSVCSKSTLSVSPNTNPSGTAEPITSMALAYPTSLRMMPPPPSKPSHTSNNNFSVPQSVPWRTTSLSKPATVLLDSAEYKNRGGNDHDSVSSAGTSTTAESSLTAAMVSRDWGANPHTSSVISNTSQLGESPASAPGVYFQCGHPHLLGVGSTATPSFVVSGQHCATSSLANALNRFNIDSDCEASVASNSIIEDHLSLMDEDDFDDNASRTSLCSHTSTGSTKSHHRAPRKKIGKMQRLMDRAAAHDRIVQRRNDRSQKMRANLVHSQRMSHSNHTPSMAIPGLLSSAMAASNNSDIPALSESPCSTSSSQASMPLMHVHHGRTPRQEGREVKVLPYLAMGDLGRTPTSSNCSDLRKLMQEMGGCPSQFAYSLPTGVHIAPATQNVQTKLQGDTNDSTPPSIAPLGCHPQLASRIPTPPPKLAAGMLPSVLKSSSVISKPLLPSDSMDSEDTDGLKSLHHTNHQATIDDVMEVAMTLSKLGERRNSPIPGLDR
eukprot:CAMPEP_0183716412 /NCGR_PEP_ID=MMETSP0737-20130205/10343_1 /TAXON_ID=385413 /ORGANISM="Thalassiosira miniscula, Strain CCMP1093" /LENGTH=614 /DNA_ID=CAMNT_0025945683 /DNA_START=896 /DNA_END=2738 /DNA_ORIENTATION=+